MARRNDRPAVAIARRTPVCATAARGWHGMGRQRPGRGREPLLLCREGVGAIMTVKRMDNVGIVVEDLDAAVEFFTEMGLVLEGRTTIEGDWSGRVTGVHGQRVAVAMMRTPD